MKKSISAVLLPLLIVGLILPLAAVLSAPQRQATTPARIGMLIRPGTPAALGAQLAVNEINASGNVRDPNGLAYLLELVYPPTFPTQTEELRATIEQLSAEGVIAILGPSENTLALPGLEPLARSPVPVLTLATADTLTDMDVTNNIMRFQAAERYYSSAVVDYMVSELGLRNIALVQTNLEGTEGLVAFEVALNSYNLNPTIKIQQETSADLALQIPAIVGTAPDAVAIWGTDIDISEFLRELRSGGFNGSVFYRNAETALLNNQPLNLDQVIGVIGASGWVYTSPTPGSRQFLVSYITAYGKFPSSEAAAAYDAIYTLASRIGTAGTTMPELYNALLQMSSMESVQGVLSPAVYTNGDFSRNVTIFQVGQFGNPEIVAHYQNNQFVTLPDAGSVVFGGSPDLGLPATTPAVLQPSLPPSATPAYLQVVITSEQANIRSGPGESFEVVGQLTQGSAAAIVGASPNFSWYVIQFQGGIGWISANVVEVFDPGGLYDQIPVIDFLPTPIGGVTVTPRLDVADIYIEGVALVPPEPLPGQGFIANVTVRNGGSRATGQFIVQGIFGSIYASNSIPNIEPGQVANLAIQVTQAEVGSSVAEFMVDTNNAVQEGPIGEANNAYRIEYRQGRVLLASRSGVALFPESVADIGDGGIQDLQWIGAELLAINGARIAPIVGVSFDHATGSELAPGTVNRTSMSGAELFSGLILGIITAEGQSGFVRIDTFDGVSLIISYRIYDL